MQSESGGNANAINNWDINAKMGDPSRGLMQVIGSTFSRFHVPGTSFNIFDPLANIAAAINYGMHTYGATLMRGGRGIGSGKGYDTGGWLPTGVTLAYNLTGQKERVLSPGEYKAYQDSGTQYHAHFDGLSLAMIDSQVRTAFNMMNLQQGNMQRPGRRS
jgi:SLT domain-containing protein